MLILYLVMMLVIRKLLRISFIEDTSIDFCPPIPNEILMCSESTIDVVGALVDSSTLILDKTYVHKNNQISQETQLSLLKLLVSPFPLSH